MHPYISGCTECWLVQQCWLAGYRLRAATDVGHIVYDDVYRQQPQPTTLPAALWLCVTLQGNYILTRDSNQCPQG